MCLTVARRRAIGLCSGSADMVGGQDTITWFILCEDKQNPFKLGGSLEAQRLGGVEMSKIEILRSGANG